MAFIQLTHRGTQRPIFIEADLVSSVEPDKDSVYVRAGAMYVDVAEDHRYVLELVEKNKTNKGGKHGN